MIVDGELEKLANGRSSPLLTGRDYVKVGSHRIKRVLLSNYLDGVLEEYVGSRVSLSFSKSILVGNQLMALRDSSGELHKSPLWQLLLTFALRFMLWAFFGGLLCVVLVVIFAMLGAAGPDWCEGDDFICSYNFLLWVKLVLPPLILWPCIRLWLDWRARQALNSLPAGTRARA